MNFGVFFFTMVIIFVMTISICLYNKIRYRLSWQDLDVSGRCEFWMMMLKVQLVIYTTTIVAYMLNCLLYE